LLALVKGPVHHRKIVWIFDPDGCGGKTSFAKKLFYEVNC